MNSELAEAYKKLELAEKALEICCTEIDKFYLASNQKNRIQTIHEDEHDLWFARDKSFEALKAIRGVE